MSVPGKRDRKCTDRKGDKLERAAEPDGKGSDGPW